MMAKWLIVHTVGGDTPTIVEWTGLNVFQWQRCMLASPCSTLCVLSYFFFFRWGIAFPMRPPLTWMILSWKTLEQPGPSLSIPFKKKRKTKEKTRNPIPWRIRMYAMIMVPFTINKNPSHVVASIYHEPTDPSWEWMSWRSEAGREIPGSQWGFNGGVLSQGGAPVR